MLIVYFRNKKGEESPEGCIELCAFIGLKVATYIGRRANHYRFALRTSSDMPPSASPHSRAPLRPAVLPTERANLTAKEPRL